MTKKAPKVTEDEFAALFGELSLTRESLNAIRAAHKKERHAGR
jgi:hypothetical protein